MDPRDRPSDTLDDAACAACGRTVPPERVRILARRDDLAFAELPCPACGTIGLAIVVATGTEVRPEAGIDPTAAPISADDLLDMHRFLAGWSGDLHGLFVRDAARDSGREAPGP